ncbi:MAG: hypothetical protein K9J16_06790 [Melioribacteraceae bacterium]|nr:hypothetical protein [Melioribacteraceae bacterium]MCF8354499.1 hypothetical protein [Melioribacteraceae bacterium]MCF8394268.1 hypothetical protein [Melioribacteraceae bacterium]MCF8418168.1 hypothetical protein [Melioribacteraceae bacterium]
MQTQDRQKITGYLNDNYEFKFLLYPESILYRTKKSNNDFEFRKLNFSVLKLFLEGLFNVSISDDEFWQLIKHQNDNSEDYQSLCNKVIESKAETLKKFTVTDSGIIIRIINDATYFIDWNEVDTPLKLIEEILHLKQKNWFVDSMLFAFVDIVNSKMNYDIKMQSYLRK